MPIVSIIIPAYNAEEFIAETLESALAQTLKDIEVIVIDDGSKDGTASVVQAYPGVRYIRQANGGVSTARNHGAQLAQGEFLAFLDSDDLWHPDKLRQQVQAMRQHPDSVFCRTAFTYQHGDAEAVRTGAARQDAPHQIISELLPSFLHPYLATSTVMVSKAAFEEAGGFDASLRIAEDVDFYLRVLAEHPKVVLMTEALVHKRPVAGSLGDDSVAGYVQLLKVYDRFLAQHPHARPVLGEANIARAYHKLHLDLARSHLWVGENTKARHAAWQAMQHGAAMDSWPLIAKSLIPAWLRRTLGSQRRLQRQATSD